MLTKHPLWLAVVCLGLLPAFSYAEQPLFRVSAEAEVRIKPDRAALTFGLSERTENLRQGAERLNQLSRRVTEYLRNRGIEERFIQTDNLHIFPVYERQTRLDKNGTRTETDKLYYELAQTFTVTLEDPTQYEDVLYALLDMGINRIENVSFYSTQIRHYRDQARRLAVQYAREKAALLAEAADMRLGKIVNISENSVPSVPQARLSNVSQNVWTDSAADSLLPAPATGMISVKSAVTLTYKIK